MAKKQKVTIFWKKILLWKKSTEKLLLCFGSFGTSSFFLQSEPHLKKHKDFTKIEYVNNTNIKFLP